MTEHRHPLPPDAPRRPGEVHTPDAVQYDRDLSVRGVVWTAVILAASGLLIVVLMWWFFVGLGRLERRKDPPAPALREVRARHLPPEPRLQSSPDDDMLALRETERRLIQRPEWIDPQQGTLRIPINIAIDVLARRGLPVAPPPVPTAPAAPTAPNTAAARPPGGGPR